MKHRFETPAAPGGRIPCIFSIAGAWPPAISRSSALLIMLLLRCAAQEPGSVATGRNGMVVTASERASRIGVRILKQGGNAVDAAVAVGFALSVTYPSAGNLGGGAYIIIRMADGREAAIDARETAPAAATASMYLDSKGAVMRDASLKGPLASGVPGSVDGLLTALSRFGTMSRDRVIGPARRLASNGYALERHEAQFLASQRQHFSEFPSSLRAYSGPGRPLRAGEIFRQPDLARTLKRIEVDGRDGFYLGETADRIVQQMGAGGGIMTRKDLADYRCIVRVPLHGVYRGCEVLTMPPSSAGGIALLQMLNILERHDVAGLGAGTVAITHLFTEAMRRAFADRWKYIGDPAFVAIPQARLLSRERAAVLDSSIDPERATSSALLLPGSPSGTEGNQTTHYCVADRWGNAVSVTTTLNSVCGGKCVVDGAGFLLNNEMDDFAAKPGEANQFGLVGNDANRIEPGKRMVSSMTPTIVLRGGRAAILLGSPGGSTIPTVVLQLCVNILDHGMPLDRALAAPRMHHQWMPDTLYHEPRAFDNATAARLAAMGHALRERETIGRVEGIVYDPRAGVYRGCSDPRGRGAAIGY